MKKYRLKRKTYTLYGVFGELYDEAGNLLGVTLEHAYEVVKEYQAKLAVGEYICVRHPPNKFPYETFLVSNVPDFQGEKVSGILIHIGNYNKDSIGCILLGSHLGAGCILESKTAFEKFMSLQIGVDSFALTVE